MTATPYIDGALACLHSDLDFSSNLQALCDVKEPGKNSSWNVRRTLDTLLRFALGRSSPTVHLTDIWNQTQNDWFNKLDGLDSACGAKRRRPDGDHDTQSTDTNKRQKLSSNGSSGSPVQDDSEPVFTLHSISVASPVRKKVDVTITGQSIQLRNPATSALESSVPLSSVKRAFLVPNMGKNKNKPHWTVIMLSQDTWDRKQEKTDKENRLDSANGGQVQIIFGVDAAPSTAKDLFTTTKHPDEPVRHAKNAESYPLLHEFLSHLPSHVAILEASSSSLSTTSTKSASGQFRSTGGHAHVDAYRAAKEGSIYFLREGILWGENKPCEFFALEDIAPDDGSYSGVKTLTATGRTFSLFVKRKNLKGEADGDGGDDEEDEMEGEESEFSMIDGKEQENVAQWIRSHKHLFGKRPVREAERRNGNDVKGKEKAREGAPDEVAPRADDESDASDEDFVDDSESDGGSATSSDEEGEGGSAQSGGEGEEEEAEDSDEEQEGGAGEEGGLDPQHHPLLRPGAMPRMSKAAVSAVVNMVNDDMGMGPESEEDELMMD